MQEKDREKIALFRFKLISPILTGQVNSQKEYLAEIATETHNVPYYGPKEYVPKTIAGWLNDYRQGGFEALKPKRRSDRGKSRKITPGLKEIILENRKEYPERSASLFYDQLIAEKKIKPSDISYSTLLRFLKRENLMPGSPRSEGERKRFAHDRVNALWQGDVLSGPYLTVEGRKLKTYLSAFIDDHSRIIPYAMFFRNERFSTVRTVLTEAILRRGIPEIIYVDNAKIYRSDRLSFACASLGINLVHTKPYDPASKGKIERFFLTARKRFIPLLTEHDLSSLDNLNQRFFSWLEEDYHRKPHRAIDMSPLDKYMAQISRVKTLDDPEKLKMLFLKREKRRVKHDATISVDSTLYEVSPLFIGKKVEVRFNPQTYENIYYYSEGKLIGKAEKVEYADNAKAKRKKNISFNKLTVEDEDNV